MMVLVDDEADQVGTEVTAGNDLAGQRSGQGLAVWGPSAFAAIAGDTGLDDEILDNEIFVPLELRPRRLVDQRNDGLGRDRQLGCLGPLVRPGALTTGCGGVGGAVFPGDWARSRGGSSGP